MMTKGKFSGGFLIFTVISILILFNTSNVKAANQRFIANGILGGVSFSIDLTDGSRIYWLYPGASGIATEFNFSGSQNMASYLIAWPFPMTEEDFVEDRQYYYTGKLSIPVYFSLKNRHKPLELKVKLNYLLCKTQCVPVEQNIEQRLPVKDGQVNLSSFAIADIEYDGEYLSFKARFDRAVEVPRFLATQEGFNFKASRLGDCEFSVVSPLTPEQYNKGAAFDIYSDMAVQPAKLVIQNLNDNKPANFAIILLLALLGGFILNFMPCVLPVLSLKLLALTKISGYRHLEEKSHPEFISGSHKMLKQVQGDRVSITFTLFGILVSFLTLSLISISLKNTGSHFGLGMNFQYPEFIIIMAMIITIFIGSVLGRVNIALPGKWTNFLARYRFRNEYLEGFSSGVIATILSTPCTAPFLGTAMSFAIAHDSIVNMAVFLTAGIGFGLPYLILTFCPGLIKYLPKPGKWLTGFKYILALLLLGTLFWLLSILYAQLGWRPTLGLFFLLVLLKFIIENIRQPFLLKLVLVISIILCGMYLPQTAYKEDLRLDIENAELWQNFDTNRILEYTSAGRIVVVDITADWCVTCKFNKFMLWDQERTIRLLRKHNVVAMRGDYTNGAENITRYLMQNHVHGIPFNVIYGPSTKDKKSSRIVLPVIVSYNELQKAIETLIKESKKYKSD